MDGEKKSVLFNFADIFLITYPCTEVTWMKCVYEALINTVLLAGESWILWEKPVAMPLYVSKIPHRLAQDQTQSMQKVTSISSTLLFSCGGASTATDLKASRMGR